MITNFKLYENFLTDKDKIKSWLDSMSIEDYTINPDLTVDVNGYVDISKKNLTEIPVQFGIVKGTFYCNHNFLTNLIGAPSNIKNSLYCNNNILSNLIGAPSIINGSVYCYNNQLTTLTGVPSTIEGEFVCSNNPLEDINDLDSKILIKSIEYTRYWITEIEEKTWDKYFDHWINKDPDIFIHLKDKISDTIKNKYDYLFNAEKFDLI